MLRFTLTCCLLAAAQAASVHKTAVHRGGNVLQRFAGALAPPAANSSKVEMLLHTGIILLATCDAIQSVRVDQWTVIRHSERELGLRGGILRRRRRAAQVGQLLGAASYTPRIVFLAGMMLRSLQKATGLQNIFDPSLGYAAGATLAAWFCKREWLMCMMAGWGLGGAYWTGFRVHPP